MTHTISADSALLSFEEFLVLQNNFRMHFSARHGEYRMVDIYLEREPYRHASTFPGFTTLAEELRKHICKEHVLEEGEYRQKLYYAYTLMRAFAHSNAELFA